ncbi:dipeptidyl peptidase 3 isoform X2 [Dendroctonus ponderosae]|uniref:dipeptidyl peptidase 3 isoform X2 n=1 Tax=Dendroctonus ponderosae TaxID=77166 RepID=UPI00203556E2|nr:dipeptidyl peptidase 3 isoform X2 [Dendroctonus ponderosae]
MSLICKSCLLIGPRKFLNIKNAFQSLTKHYSILKSTNFPAPEPLKTVSSAKMTLSVDKAQHVLPLDQPFVKLEIQAAFNGLTDRERLYAHHISKASWVGGLITLIQTSPESGPLFVLLHKVLSCEKPEQLMQSAIKAGFSGDEVKAFYVYAAGVIANSGNYKGFGDTKIIPDIDPNRLEQLLSLSLSWPSISAIWNSIKHAIYDLGPGKTCLGYHPQGCSTYISKNVTPEDTTSVQNWMKSRKLECYNTRLFKTEKNNKVFYEIRMASEEKKDPEVFEDGDATYCITYGDYSSLMGQVAKNLEAAVQFAANDMERNMLESYVSSFKTGSLDDHKKGSRYWIQDKGPAVETYIGFIETYRDPAGVRAEFEGFVAAVNREMSRKFTTLVSNAESFLKLLPWTRELEKDEFLKPDFTSLDVLTFAGSGIPAGINIPNYDDIRQTEGFKNVSLGNVIPASYQQSVTPFLSQSDADLLQKWRVHSFELQVGLHELLGHGSGKLLQKAADGTTNYPPTLLDPLTGKPPTSWYEPGDTYDTLFGPLSSTYEECRAEAVGLYLSVEPEVLKIFGHEGSQAEEVLYVNWLSLIWGGAGRGLELWEPGRGWLQAHAQARYVLSQVLIEAGVVKVTQPSEGDLLITLDRSAIKGAGRCAIGHFLLQLQVFKATGNVKAAKALYDHYSEVNEPWLGWRSIVLEKKQPRKIFVQANTTVENSKVQLREYGASIEGFIQSWVERFDNPEHIYDALLQQSKADEIHF